MKKLMFLVLVLLFLLAPFRQAVGAEDELTLKPVPPAGTWNIMSPKGQQLGILRTVEDGAYSVQLMNGEYMGFILKNGDLKKTTRHPAISTNESRFHLDLWAAIQKMKKATAPPTFN